METQQLFHVMCSYILDFCLLCDLGDIVSGNGLLLFKILKLLHDSDKHIQTSQLIFRLPQNKQS